MSSQANTTQAYDTLELNDWHLTARQNTEGKFISHLVRWLRKANELDYRKRTCFISKKIYLVNVLVSQIWNKIIISISTHKIIKINNTISKYVSKTKWQLYLTYNNINIHLICYQSWQLPFAFVCHTGLLHWVNQTYYTQSTMKSYLQKFHHSTLELQVCSTQVQVKLQVGRHTKVF